MQTRLPLFDTEYDRANVPPYNGNDPPPAPGSLKRSLFPTLLNEVQNKGTQGVRARYGAELPPIISIVRHPGRPVISVPDLSALYTRTRTGTSRKTVWSIWLASEMKGQLHIFARQILKKSWCMTDSLCLWKTALREGGVANADHSPCCHFRLYFCSLLLSRVIGQV